MSARLFPRATRHYALLGAGCAALTLLASCASSPAQTPVAPAQSTAESPASLSVVRYSRYTLVELEPTAAQLDLLSQIIDITLPTAWSTTVGDALRYVLLRSGYALCESRDGLDDLLLLPLPASHFHLGPLRLRQVLELLAGPAWQLEVDERARSVCYLHSAPATASTTSRPLS